MDEELIKSVKLGKNKVGKAQLLKHLNGVRLTQREAIKAKCYDCDGMGDSGACDMASCSLFPYSSYRGKQPPRDPAHRAKGSRFYIDEHGKNQIKGGSL